MGPSLFPHPLLKSRLPHSLARRPQELHVLVPPWPPRPTCQTHGDPLDSPTLRGRLQVPMAEPSQPREPHLPLQPARPPGHSSVPAATRNPLGVTSALGTSPALAGQSGTSSPATPLCPLPAMGPWHPLPPWRWHQSLSCQRPGQLLQPHLGRLAGSPLPAQGTGG